MFNKNDKALLTARIIIMVVIIVLAVFTVIGGLILAIEVSATHIVTMLIGLLFCWIAWIMAKLYLSYLCDIKLIRNKLYGENNNNLDVFLENYNAGRDNVSEIKQDVQDIKKQMLLFTQQLFIDGKITEEEYRKRLTELNNEDQND